MKIGIIGSPGAGKTTLTSGLFYFLKIRRINVEKVPELIKYKVYEGADFSAPGFDILNTLEQKKFEEIFIKENKRHKIDVIICEAPICNGYFYSSFYDKVLEHPILEKIAKDHINTYDVLLFLERKEKDEYVSFGRKESLSEAKKLEKHIKDKITDLGFKNKLILINQKTSINEVINLLGL